jgi:hypothetical protein
MNGLGMTVPSQFIERNAVKEVLQIIQVARDRIITIYYPTDLWCLKNGDSVCYAGCYIGLVELIILSFQILKRTIR